MDQFKVGDVVRLKNRTPKWHIRNNSFSHMSFMNQYIGQLGVVRYAYSDEIGVIFDHDLNGTLAFPPICLELDDTKYITELSKLINKIYVKEKKKNDRYK